MVFLVPFDGSALATTALSRASEFATYADERVVVCSVIPDDVEYARERGWLSGPDAFEPAAIASQLEGQVRSVAPEVSFRWESIEPSPDPTATLTTDVVRTIRSVAAELEASVLFVGSENAGRVSTPLTSVGSPVSNDPRYDVHIVRHPREEAQ
jgi:nucleotide-binding universal stress UspA family protein